MCKFIAAYIPCIQMVLKRLPFSVSMQNEIISTFKTKSSSHCWNEKKKNNFFYCTTSVVKPVARIVVRNFVISFKLNQNEFVSNYGSCNSRNNRIVHTCVSIISYLQRSTQAGGWEKRTSFLITPQHHSLPPRWIFLSVVNQRKSSVAIIFSFQSKSETSKHQDSLGIARRISTGRFDSSFISAEYNDTASVRIMR